MSLDVSLLCPCCKSELFTANITANVDMAKEAGVYMPAWRPDECDIKTAAELAPLLSAGIDLLAADPARFKAFNLANGRNSYDNLLEFLREYRDACLKHPSAEVSVWR